MSKTNGSVIRGIVFTVPVTPADSDLADGPTRGIMVTEDGTVAVTYVNGRTDTIQLSAGMVHPISVIRIRSGGTATGIKAAY